MLDRGLVRNKNRIKSLYRSRGVAVSGKAAYGSERAEFLKRLPESTRSAAELLYRQLDALTELKADAREQLIAESHRHHISRLLETCPGLGPVRVAQLLPVVVAPERFRTARQFWAYCGLAIVMRSSQRLGAHRRRRLNPRSSPQDPRP